ncbi:hypothetical protein [Butyrivibrio sp. AE2032]|uniref:hypothetical protein n=1 Tax=Butyrivibrio sp. AE2032 TaxID=1458463 RepID=UPI00054F6998|nr:hypothetical protein [Butyrivibrio sp. AE2032]
MGLKKILAVVMTAGMIMSFMPATAMADGGGWRGNDKDGWSYYTSDTEYVKSDWKKISGKWYYFDESGIMQTGWVLIKGKWYFFGKDGAMKTGWLQDGGKWYYLLSNGAAVTNDWKIIGGKHYHFNKSGAMETGKWIDCGESFYSQMSGASYDAGDVFSENFVKLMKEFRGVRNWRYVGDDGAAYTGWHKVDGSWYFFEYGDSNSSFITMGNMAYYFTFDSDGELYYFGKDGKYLKNAWRQGIFEDASVAWWYMGADGRVCKGWKAIGGKWYYFDEYDGSMVTGELLLGDVWYYFKDSGEMLTGWYSVMVDGEKRWIYANSDGSLVYDDWLQKGDKFYYFDGPFMVSNVVGFVIEDLEYDFYPSGECANPNAGRPIAVG